MPCLHALLADADVQLSQLFSFRAMKNRTVAWCCGGSQSHSVSCLILPWINVGVHKNFFGAVFLWKFLFWTLSIFKRGPDIRIFPTLSNFKNVKFIYTNFSRVRLDFIFSNAGWALFHANRSLFRIIWWNWRIMYNNYKIYYQYPPNPRTHRTQEPPNPRTTELRNHRF